MSILQFDPRTRPQSSRVSSVSKFMYQAHVVDGLDGDGRTQVATVSTATIRQPPSGKPSVSHFPHTQRGPTSVRTRRACCQSALCVSVSPDERQQRLSVGSLRKWARTLACTARRHTGTAAGLFGLDEPTNAMCSSHRRLCARARSTRSADTRQSRGARHALCCAIDPGCRLPIVVCG